MRRKKSEASWISSVFVLAGAVLVVRYAVYLLAAVVSYGLYVGMRKYIAYRQERIENEVEQPVIEEQPEEEWEGEDLEEEQPDEEQNCDAEQRYDGDDFLRILNIDTAIDRTMRRLELLYERKDRYEYVYRDDMDRCKASKAWRGLMWDIANAEQRLELLEKLKETDRAVE